MLQDESGIGGGSPREGLALKGMDEGAYCCLSRKAGSYHSLCNDPTIGSYNHYHLSPNGIPRGNQRWYRLVYLIKIAGKPRIRPRE